MANLRPLRIRGKPVLRGALTLPGKGPHKEQPARMKAAGLPGNVIRTVLHATLTRNLHTLNLETGYDESVVRNTRALCGRASAVDHIIPRAVVPELDEKLFNLEFMPTSVNRKKSAVIGQRQRSLAKEWNDAGLLSNTGLKAVVPSSNG